MLSLKLLKEQPDFVIERLAVKNFDARGIVAGINELNDRRRNAQTELDSLLALQKVKAKEIGALMKEGKKEEAESCKAEVANLKKRSGELETAMQEIETELNSKIVLLPNLPCKDVPCGKGAEDNVVIREGGAMPDLSENALPHWELLEKLDIVDFDLGVKITGAGFPVYKGKGARLQRALIEYFLDKNTKAGYTEYMLPLMVNEASGFGTGQLPDKEGQMYHVGLDNFYLIPTAEVPATNLYRDIILSQEDLPVKLTAYTPCFRREAGSYGKDVRGLNRLHQFDKVEIVQITRPFTSAITYDFEVFSAAQKRWLEVSSVSNFESYQANRLKLRYRDDNRKPQLAHTLNGSSLALPRIVAAMLENFQKDGKVIIPEVLRDYTGFSVIE